MSNHHLIFNQNMANILGLDLGQNSIGWVTHKKKDVRIQNKPYKNFIRIRTNPVISTLSFCSILSFTLTLINQKNWNFWLNISISVSLTLLSLLHRDRNK